jgi:hypothetical protein
LLVVVDQVQKNLEALVELEVVELEDIGKLKAQ